MSDVLLDVSRIPTLCDLGPRLLTMTGIFRAWLTTHFSDPDNIEDDDLNCYIWNSDPLKSKIAIEPITKWDPLQAGKRPAIYIKRLAWRQLRISIDNRMHGHLSDTGEFQYANYWQGGHTFFIICREAGEAEKLATEVFRELNQFGPVVRQHTGMHRFEVAEVGELAKLEEARENFVVPVSVAYALEESWIVVQQSPILKSFDLAMLEL